MENGLLGPTLNLAALLTRSGAKSVTLKSKNYKGKYCCEKNRYRTVIHFYC